MSQVNGVPPVLLTGTQHFVTRTKPTDVSQSATLFPRALHERVLPMDPGRSQRHKEKATMEAVWR